jgi:hypothetical protein
MLNSTAVQNMDKLQRAVVELTATALTNAQILIDKGICTEAEWESTKVRVEAHLDQATAAKREESLAAIAAMDPVTKLFFDVTGVDLSKVEE